MKKKPHPLQAPRPAPAASRRPGGGNLLLFLTVTLSGAAVMILELLGTRLIGPFYGVSLYVWSSLIAVTLVALALGYYLGGYLADRYPGFGLAHVILLSSAACVAIPFLSGPVLGLTNPLGIRGGAFASAFLLFTPALTCLAMVGPFVIKLATRDLQGVGMAVGSVYAVSTLGSVAGTLLFGFYLLPHFGVRAILFALSLALMALAGLLTLPGPNRPAQPLAAWPLLVGAVLVSLLTSSGFAQSSPGAPGFKVLHEAETIYGWVRVVDDEKNDFRLLLSDASVLSAVDIAHGRSLLGYQVILGQLPLFRPRADQALLIGLGGGHVAKNLKGQGISTDTIEIDPAVADAARGYFDFKPTGDFIVGDARYEITRLTKRYDFIIHDCFTGGSEPTHLLTREMLASLRGLLKADGILALNYVGYAQGEGADAVASVYQTLASVFPTVRVFITEKQELTDFIFLASASALEPDPANPRTPWLLRHAQGAPAGQGVVITDDYNPMESMQVRKAEAYRKLFMERIAFDLLRR